MPDETVISDKLLIPAWEYTSIEVDPTAGQGGALVALNKAGDSGWEMCGMHLSAQGSIFVMKRKRLKLVPAGG